MEYIRFNVDRQKLYYNQKRYFSTDTIDTLYCKFGFAVDSSGNIRGEWDLGYIWAQFHDEKGNTYVKPVEDNVCSIPYDCLRQHEFKMTLFATDTKDYIACKKRYTTNEISFLFDGQANLDYNSGVDPEPTPSQWEIVLNRVYECEDKVDELSQDVSEMGDKVDAFDDRITANENDIEDLSTRLANESTARINDDANLQSLIDDERTARENADTRLEGLIDDRYTKTETDALIGNEATARESADADLQASINNRYTKAETDALLDAESTARESADADLQSAINDRYTKTEIDALIGDESTSRANADANLQLLINDRYTKAETDALLDAKQDKLSTSQMNVVNSGLTSNDKTMLDNLSQSVPSIENRVAANEGAIEDTNATVELLYKTLKKDNSWTELAELVRSGKASQYLDYGNQIEENWIDVDNNNKEYSNPWDVAKFEDVETREGTIHGMFLKTHWATLRPIQFSHNRDFYSCRDGLSAGTYHITLGADWGTNAKKDKSYQFTIANDVPEGGKLAGFYSMPDVAPSNWKVYVYDANSIDILENAITVTEGTDGTSLGTLKFDVRDGNLNSMQETAYGCNDWEISAYRQYLNSRKGKGEWWIAQDEWDIAPDQLKTVSGFLCGISDELYNAMRTVKVKTWKNNPVYGGIESYTYDKVFLPSKEELYYTPQKAGEGTYYPLMKEQLGLDSPLADYTNYAPNITYAIENHSSAQYVRLRSANLYNASNVWYANASGNVSNYSTAYASRCTPACVIG